MRKSQFATILAFCGILLFAQWQWISKGSDGKWAKVAPIDVPYRQCEAIPMASDAFIRQEDETVTIILNVFQGSPMALSMQLESAVRQRNATVAHVWVNAFASPYATKFEQIFEGFVVRVGRGEFGTAPPELHFTKSTFNFKFHGRFLLGYMAPSKYLLLADDDAPIGRDSVANLIQLQRKHRGVWGSFGHLRGHGNESRTDASNKDYKSWPGVNVNRSQFDHYEQDYLSGMWFIERGWLEFFLKERPWTWETGEDIHLSHSLRKFLNLNTYGGVVGEGSPNLPPKSHTATKGRFFEMREHLFDHTLGRGNKIADVRPTIDTLIYVETASEIHTLLSLMRHCRRRYMFKLPWYCTLGRTAAVFRGTCTDQDVPALIVAAKRLCATTRCESYALKSEFRHPIAYFNMRQDFGNNGEHIPISTSVSDLVPSLSGILHNVGPIRFVVSVPPCHSQSSGSEQNLYASAVVLAFAAFRNAPPNLKFSEMNHMVGHEVETIPRNFRETEGILWDGKKRIRKHNFGLGACI